MGQIRVSKVGQIKLTNPVLSRSIEFSITWYPWQPLVAILIVFAVGETNCLSYIPESGVKIAILELDRFQSVNLAQDVISQIL